MLFPEYRPKERSAVPKEQPKHQVQKSTHRLYDVKERACGPRRHASSSAKVTTVFVRFLQKQQIVVHLRVWLRQNIKLD